MQKNTSASGFPLVFSAAFAIHCAPTPYAPIVPSASCFAIHNVTLIDVEAHEGREIPAQSIVVCGKMIADVSPTKEHKTRKDSTDINGTGLYAMAGFSDSHAHIRHPSELALYLSYGITTIRNMWGAPMHLRMRKQIADGTLDGPLMYNTGPIVDGEKYVHDGSFILKTKEEARALVHLHKRMKYDFIKVYSRLEKEPFLALMHEAKQANIPVVGHVPRSVGLQGAIRAGIHSIEHGEGLLDALQPDDSALRGQYGPGVFRQKLEHMDVSFMSSLADEAKHVWHCPTLVVKQGFGPSETRRNFVNRQEIQWIHESDRAIWTPNHETSDDERKQFELESQMNVQWLRTLRNSKARLLIGTDTGNPLVIPGLSVHEEMKLWASLGLTNAEILRAATINAAIAYGKQHEFGAIRNGLRANLLLLNKSPLQSIEYSQDIHSVIAHGRVFRSRDLADLRSSTVKFNSGQSVMESDVQTAHRFSVRWRKARFGIEHMSMSTSQGKSFIRSKAFDFHSGQHMSWTSEQSENLSRTKLASSGPRGEGHATLTAADHELVAEGQLLQGVPFYEKIAVDVHKFIPEKSILFAQDAAKLCKTLAPNESRTSIHYEVHLGSEFSLKKIASTIRRTDGPSVQCVISEKNRQKGRVTVSPDGSVQSWVIPSHGALVEYTRESSK